MLKADIERGDSRRYLILYLLRSRAEVLNMNEPRSVRCQGRDGDVGFDRRSCNSGPIIELLPSEHSWV